MANNRKAATASVEVLPRKPLSSYMLFRKDVYEKVIAENPGMHNMIDITKLIAARWNSLNDKRKEKYKNKAIKLRQEYVEQLKEFHKKHRDIPEPKKVKAEPKSKLDDLGFAKPKSPDQLFFDSMCEKYPDSSHSDLLEKCKTKWSKMSEKKKATWIEIAQKEEADYQENLRKYQSEHRDYKAPPLKTLISKRDKNILNLVSGKPEKPASSGYTLYSREKLQNGSFKDIPSKDRLAVIAEKWKALSKSEQDTYNATAKKMMDEYIIKYEKFLNSSPPEKRVLEVESAQPKRQIRLESKDIPRKKKRKVTEPEKPPETAFELFKEKNKDEWNLKSVNDIDNQAKLRWKKLSKTERRLYGNEVEALRTLYITKFSQYLISCPEKLQEFVSIFTSHNRPSAITVTASSCEEDSD